MNYEEIQPGNLALMLWYQSLDGRLQIEYYDTLDEAMPKFNHLVNLGRKPQIWHQVKI